MESRMRSKVACTVREGAGYFANQPISSQDSNNNPRKHKNSQTDQKLSAKTKYIPTNTPSP